MTEATLEPGSLSAGDIASQTIGWRAALDAVSDTQHALQHAWRTASPHHVVIAGCGSPLFLASSAATLLADVGRVGVPITVAPADEVRRAPLDIAPVPSETLLIVISRSGSTSEVLEAVDVFRAAGGRDVWAVTCRSQSPIVSHADVAIAIDGGFEPTVAQTRSFSSMLVGVQALAAVLGGHDLDRAAGLADAGLDVLHVATERVATIDLGPDTTRIDFVGSGANYGLAREAMLKMSEMALTNSAAYHVLEYRHGPISMVDDHSLLVGLIDADHEGRERAVLADVKQLGGRVVALDDTWIPETGRRLPPWTRPVLMMPALQLIAHRRAVQNGLDPDRPRHLQAVVHLEDAAEPRPPTTPTAPSTTSQGGTT